MGSCGFPVGASVGRCGCCPSFVALFLWFVLACLPFRHTVTVMRCIAYLFALCVCVLAYPVWSGANFLFSSLLPLLDSVPCRGE